MIYGMNSTKFKEGNSLIREFVHHYSRPALIAKLISTGWTCYWRRKIKKKMQYNFYMGIKNSVTLVRERTIPTERPPPVGEVSANFCG